MPVSSITHYVYISFDLKSVEIIGHAHAIRTRIDLSNLAITSFLGEA